MAEAAVRRADRKTARIWSDPALRGVLVLAVLVSLSYYVTSKIGFAFALQPGSVSILWMPNSIMLAALLVCPKRFWWVIVLAAFPAHFASELQSGVPTALVLSWFVSNSFQALFGAFCINHFISGPLKFDRFTHLAIFVLFGALLSPFVASFVDVTFVKLNNWGTTPYWEIWIVRFLSNVLTTLTLVPAALIWTQDGLKSLRNIPARRYSEAALLMVGLIGVGILVFATHQEIGRITPSMLYWPLPFLLWAAIRFGPRGVSISLLVVMFLAIFGATHGQGPFIAGSSIHNAMSIQWFLIFMSIPLMVLAAVIEERRRAESVARENEERLTMALNAAQMGTWTWQIPEDRVTWPQDTGRVFGLSDADSGVTLAEFLSVVHPDDHDRVESTIRRAVEDAQPYEIEFRLATEGMTRWVMSKGKVTYEETGEPLQLVGVGIDITERKRADQALHESNARNQAILRAIPDMMFLQSRDGVFLDYYTRDPNSLLLPPKDFIGKNVREVMPSDLADRVLAAFERLHCGAESQTLEYSLELKGEERHYEARLVAADGDKVLSIVRDLTEARRAQASLSQSEKKLYESNQEIRSLAGRLITAQESERRRISLLLHDDVSQTIAVLAVAVSRLKRKLKQTNTEAREELDMFGLYLNELSTQIRNLSHQLHPEVLEHVGLVAALESHIRDFRQQEQIHVSMKADVEREHLSLEQSICLYHVAFEALRNISKHSKAKTATLFLTEDEDFFTLEISDSGKGFDVERAKQGSGIGILCAEERVKLLHGTFEVKSVISEGTTMVAKIPREIDL